MREVLLDLQRTCGTTILYTSHNMHEVQRMCNRIIFSAMGSVIATGTPIEVTRNDAEGRTRRARSRRGLYPHRGAAIR